ncbi:ABC transporter substrate-binding protein [Campylobacter sp. RM16192]|uniref:ABC transporter substrate-binding protein n=1 Tax=Campylobacter sp. RM16192 TaxID=1660080 RepID=UPI001451F1C3|nr:ABC transporter substrate-binding protein [Campylobacter sp. RM16192]QCD51996.1 nitrate/sulfonate/bicarbonate ABC transporter, periplasmic substrate-binding protein [Campylobacter sp. RM16192]
MKRRNFLGLGAALGVTALAPDLFAKERFDIWGMPAIPSTMLAVATMQGELNKTHDMKLRIWSNPDQLRAGVASGDMKLTAAPSNVGVNLANQGIKFGMLNIMTNGLQNVLVKDASIKSIEDLVGKKLIMPFKNDMPDLVLRAICKKRGIDISKIDITYVQTPPESVGLFLQKDYDAALSIEPMSSAAILKGKKMGVDVSVGFELPEIWGESFGVKPYIPQAGLIVSLDYYNANREVFEVFHNDLQNSLKWILQNKQSAAKIGAQYLPAPEPALANAFERSNLTVTKASDLADELMSFFEVLFELNPKILGGKMPDKSLFL